jgi:hypothetical protein
LRGLHVVEGERGIIAVLAHPQTDKIAHIFGAQIAAEFNGCACKIDRDRLGDRREVIGTIGISLDAYRAETSVNNLVVGEDRAGRPTAPPARHVAGNGSLETQGWFKIGAECSPIRFGLLSERHSCRNQEQRNDDPPHGGIRLRLHRASCPPAPLDQRSGSDHEAAADRLVFIPFPVQFAVRSGAQLKGPADTEPFINARKEYRKRAVRVKRDGDTWI